MNVLYTMMIVCMTILLVIVTALAIATAYVFLRDFYKDKRKSRTTGWKEETIKFHDPIGYENYIIKKEEPK